MIVRGHPARAQYDRLAADTVSRIAHTGNHRGATLVPAMPANAGQELPAGCAAGIALCPYGCPHFANGSGIQPGRLCNRQNRRCNRINATGGAGFTELRIAALIQRNYALG